jgi:hypothetical protein
MVEWMSRTIELPDDVYKDLEKVARERGLSPADWIAATLPVASGLIEERPLSELLQGLIGAVDSSKGPQSGNARTPFGELIARKFERQGLHRPWARLSTQALLWH